MKYKLTIQEKLKDLRMENSISLLVLAKFYNMTTQFHTLNQMVNAQRMIYSRTAHPVQ